MVSFSARGKFLSMAMFVSFNLRENGEEWAFSILPPRSLFMDFLVKFFVRCGNGSRITITCYFAKIHEEAGTRVSRYNFA